jgi:hypothetical protein
MSWRGVNECSNFLLIFEGATDPWDRSRIVGQRISELRASFLKMPEAQRMVGQER